MLPLPCPARQSLPGRGARATPSWPCCTPMCASGPASGHARCERRGSSLVQPRPSSATRLLRATPRTSERSPTTCAATATSWTTRCSGRWRRRGRGLSWRGGRAERLAAGSAGGHDDPGLAARVSPLACLVSPGDGATRPRYWRSVV
ncbi:hypothetical protein FOCC_FOCC013045 [Frankliniella occidentalis]|nr:hypothetical protein FOCC_FOCC013045 [Frankliniella occidentalis]